MPSSEPQVRDERSVFLNVPFDEEYASLFLTLLAGLVSLGRTPHSVLEVTSGGQNRLQKIFELVASCGASIHDLSRVTLSGPLQVPRFNMPFELGMAYAIAQRSTHSFFVFEAQPYRLQASLSDLNGHDPHIHEESRLGILRCVLDCFGSPSEAPPISSLNLIVEELTKVVLRVQAEQNLRHPFHPYVFRLAVRAAATIARTNRLID